MRPGAARASGARAVQLAPKHVELSSLPAIAPARVFYHGASTAALLAIERGEGPVRPSYRGRRSSLGGAYFTRYRDHAEAFARRAAREAGGAPVLLVVRRPRWARLLPDEDWVVAGARELPRLTEGPDAGDFVDPRLRAFFDDLYEGFFSDGPDELGQHYKLRYEELNARHDITGRDSWDLMGTCRQADVLRVAQVTAWARVPPRGVTA